MLNSKKIIAGFVILLAGILITFLKGDVPPNLLSLMQLIYGSLVAGNAMQHYTANKFRKEIKDEKSSSS